MVLTFQEGNFSYYYTFKDTEDLLEGVVIKPQMLGGYPNNTFTDGIKTLTLSFDGKEPSTTEGFAAIIADKVMREAANYKLEMNLQMKEAIWDRIVLLNNLSMAATVGSIGNFEDNLKLLERIL